jgi:50S ribosomal protein L4
MASLLTSYSFNEKLDEKVYLSKSNIYSLLRLSVTENENIYDIDHYEFFTSTLPVNHDLWIEVLMKTDLPEVYSGSMTFYDTTTPLVITDPITLTTYNYVNVLDLNGKDTGRKVQLSDSVFGIEPNNHAVYLDVKQYLANQRQGTHKAKERAEVAGSTRKIKKQKGTGTARAGSAKNPLFKGGGTVFGPRPRSYSFKLNKGLKRLARKSAFSIKAKESNLIVVEDFSFEAPNTKNFINVFVRIGEVPNFFGLTPKSPKFVFNQIM